MFQQRSPLRLAMFGKRTGLTRVRASHELAQQAVLLFSCAAALPWASGGGAKTRCPISARAISGGSLSGTTVIVIDLLRKAAGSRFIWREKLSRTAARARCRHFARKNKRVLRCSDDSGHAKERVEGPFDQISFPVPGQCRPSISSGGG